MSGALRRRFVIGLTGMAGLAAGLAAAPAAGQEAPSTSTIIEALKPTTRSSRNLIIVERPATPASDAAGAAPIPHDTGAQPGDASRASARPSISMAIHFDFDSWRIRPESAVALDNLAAALVSSELRSSKFLLEGHTDASGGAAYNQRLSQQRADEVKRVLVARGVPADRVASVGRGATQLSNSAEPRSAENRRVRLVNLE